MEIEKGDAQTTIEIEKGDTLWAISRKYGVRLLVFFFFFQQIDGFMGVIFFLLFKGFDRCNQRGEWSYGGHDLCREEAGYSLISGSLG